MKVKIESRQERYNAAVNLAAVGVPNAGIARVIGSDVRFVERLLAARQWPEGRRNAWLLGLDIRKFHCV